MFTRLIPAILLCSVTNAAVIAKRAADQMVWKSPNGGNTQVRFGDDKVYVGGCEPKSIINSVYDNCYGEGFCNPKSWTMQCIQGDRATHTITITAPEGQYQPWIKNGLVEAMNAAIAVEGIVNKERITAMSGGGCVGCPWYSKNIDVYHMPGTIGISHLNEGTVPDVITLNIVNNDEAEAGGLCEILTGIGSGVAGSVNGAAGGLFQLGSVACKAI
ncbi:hypothetical protein BKA66DRAFT_436449 [Pyrenochaeta sp. MPI-SDFR-AT-0127]|nr:hypothetical protein BKA66DRAFT_436449 [Pyrenochaeta sp. MPI-SDFR-AT-0127]